MADNLRKYTTQEVLNKVFTDSSGNSIGINSSTTKETLNAVFSTSDNSLNVALSGGSISGDVTISGDLTVEGSATNTYDEIIQGTLRLDAPGSVATTLEFVPTTSQASQIKFYQDDGSTQDARIFAPEGAEDLAFEAGTTEIMRMTPTNVQIGTHTSGTPTASNLFVVGTGAATEGIKVARGGGGQNPLDQYAQLNMFGGTSNLISRGGTSGEGTIALVTTSDDSTYNTRLFVNSNGNIGIGTATPDAKLHIFEDLNNAATATPTDSDSYQLFINGATGSTGDTVGIALGTTDGNDNVSASIVAIDTGSAGIADLAFYTKSSSNTAERMRISSAGDVTMSGTLTVNGDLADISGAHPTLKLTDIAPDDNYGTIGYSDGALSIGTNGGDDAGAADTIIFYNHGSTERMRIASGGNVSIGNNSSPDTLLHVYKADASQTAHSDSLLTIENSGSTYMTILSGATSHGQIHFGDSGQNDDGVVGYDQATNKFYVLTNHSTTKKFQVDANGASTFQATADTTVATFKGFEGNNGTIEIHADEGDDNADQWRLTANTAGKLSIGNYSTGAWVNHITLDADSRFSMSNNGGEPTNTIFGYQAGNSIHGSSGMNTFFGHQVADATMTATADENTAVGHLALSSLTSGAKNIAIGSYAGINITTGDENVVIGRSAGNNHNSSDLVAIGTATLASISDAAADGTVAVGYNALTALTSGALNTVLGYKAGGALTTGASNVFIGYQSGQTTHTDSTANVAIGRQSFAGTHTGSASTSNVAIGNLAMGAGACNAADNNVAIGDSSLEDITTANGNVCVGFQSGTAITTGIHNICIGYQAGNNITESQGNVLIGTGAAAAHATASSGDNSIVISAGTNAVTSAGTETIRIGVDTDFITNDFGEDATWSHSSDERIKKDIEDNTLGLDFINDLRTVTFKKKAPSEYPKEFDTYNETKTERNNPNRISYGFIAQEVKASMDKAGHSEFPVWKENADTMQELGETELITPLVKAIQELTARVKELEAKLK